MNFVNNPFINIFYTSYHKFRNYCKDNVHSRQYTTNIPTDDYCNHFVPLLEFVVIIIFSNTEAHIHLKILGLLSLRFEGVRIEPVGC